MISTPKTSRKASATDRTWAEINTDALKYNFDLIRKSVPENIAVMAVIKADAYGHGAAIVAEALKDRADCFMVAEINEAMELRELGVDAPILIAGMTDPERAPMLTENSLTQCVYSLDYAKALDSKVPENKKLKVHIKLDTGMSRLGFLTENETAPDEVAEVFKLKNLDPEGVFTHFAECDDTDSDFTNEQIKRFYNTLNVLEARGIKFKIKHTANSAGAIASDLDRSNMARVGVLLYGSYPSEQIRNKWLEKNPPLRPVMRLKTRVAQIKTLPEGVGVGYGRHFFTRRETKIAVLSAGYADGLPRLMANSPEAHAIDTDTKLVGSVCMDMCFADVTESKNPPKPFDEVTLFGGEGITAEDWASAAKTINYEIFCQITSRVPRIEVRDK